MNLSRMGLTLVVLLAGRLASAYSLDIPSNAEILKSLSGKLAGQSGDYLIRHVQRMGNKTIEMETMIATDGDPKLANAILTDFAHYRNWMLQGLNHRPAGGEYLLKIRDFAIKPGDPSVLVANVTFDLPLFKIDLLYAIKVGTKKENDGLTITAEALPQPANSGLGESPIKSTEAFAKIFPAPKHRDVVWIYLKGRTVLNNWLLYEALPDKVLERETGDRLQIIVDNYHREESQKKPDSEAPAVARSSATNEK